MKARFSLACFASIAVFIAATQAGATDKDISFKNLFVGKKTTHKEVEDLFTKEQYGFKSCSDDGRTTYLCLGDAYIGQYVGTATVQVENGVVEQISFVFHSNFYNDVRDALVSKYGQSDKSDNENLKNGYGSSFTSENLYWFNGKRDSIYLSSIFGKVSQSGFIMSTQRYLDKEQAGRKLKGGDL